MPETLGHRLLYSPDGQECKNIAGYGDYLKEQAERLRAIYMRLFQVPNCVRKDEDLRALHIGIDLLIARGINPADVGIDIMKLAELDAEDHRSQNEPHHNFYLQMKAEGEEYLRQQQERQADDSDVA